jgi:LPXTG-motif cell wall-anchored protein
MHRRTRAWVATAVVALGTSLIATTAGAASSTPLANAIRIVPPAGWVVQPGVLPAQDTVGGSPGGVSGVASASKEWRQPNSQNLLSVTLVTYEATDIGAIQSGLAQPAKLCGQGEKPETGTVAGLPGSVRVTCVSVSTSANSTYGQIAIGWVTGDTLGELHADGVPSAQMDQYALQVASAIPGGGTTAAATSTSGHSTTEIALIGLLIVLIALGAFFLRRRRSGAFSGAAALDSRAPAHAARVGGMRSADTLAAGWHASPDDPSRIGYWDGSQWTAYRQWDGRQWADAGVRT